MVASHFCVVQFFAAKEQRTIYTSISAKKIYIGGTTDLWRFKSARNMGLISTKDHPKPKLVSCKLCICYVPMCLSHNNKRNAKSHSKLLKNIEKNLNFNTRIFVSNIFWTKGSFLKPQYFYAGDATFTVYHCSWTTICNSDCFWILLWLSV